MIMVNTLNTSFGTLSVDVSLSDQLSGWSSKDRHFGRSVSQPRRHSRQRLHAGKPYCEHQLNSQASTSIKNTWITASKSTPGALLLPVLEAISTMQVAKNQGLAETRVLRYVSISQIQMQRAVIASTRDELGRRRTGITVMRGNERKSYHGKRRPNGEGIAAAGCRAPSLACACAAWILAYTVEMAAFLGRKDRHLRQTIKPRRINTFMNTYNGCHCMSALAIWKGRGECPKPRLG
jgi:hypothetical protein